MIRTEGHMTMRPLPWLGRLINRLTSGPLGAWVTVEMSEAEAGNWYRVEVRESAPGWVYSQLARLGVPK